ncbi:MAG: NADPH-dependent F420 reductase [Byssovorax sp.]
MRIGIVGGTGREGKGLAMRWARAGHEVRIGSRDAERAKARAAELAAEASGIQGGDNGWCVRESEVVLLSVPYAAHAETLKGLAEDLAGRVLIDITVPLKPPKVTLVNLPEGRSAAMEAQALLGPTVKVVAALHHVSSAHLGEPDHAIECDVLIAGDDEAAKATVLALIADLGLKGLDAGPLPNAVALESLTPVLLYLNRKYKGTAGLRITGLP